MQRLRKGQPVTGEMLSIRWGERTFSNPFALV